ncbi:unnamed protein product [Adineta steineri]|uniref:Uncharacterized protein n=2 Tax=Adineta steineri TaxID=433720 RepID=A0A819CCL4_9BILA|nr:unnamed protein product [Adineta steineri]CAF3809721.1 unnamed protein product [Adineta steineri]
MGRNYKNLTTTETIAIGIEGDRHSLCGAIKRVERTGIKSNNLLTLKEQCARHIALMKHEQNKWFITAYLPPHLFKYVTKDIFDLRRDEFKLNYAKPLYMCQECTMDTYEDPPDDCQCPQIDTAIDTLNTYLFKKLNNNMRRNKNITRKFELIYKIPNDEEDHSDELKDSTSFFLYLTPVQHSLDIDEYTIEEGPFDEYKLLNGQISVEDKLLFIDAMRFFGGFRTKYRQPQLILYRRCEFELC